MSPRRLGYLALKRALDAGAAAAGLVVLAPALLAVGAAIRLTSPGPALFRQRRVGRDGRPFQLVKFRTMVPEAPAQGPSITRRGDPRVTPLGRLLRRTKIDELPELVNVLRGEMSLVGPRPEVARYVALYTPAQRRVLDVRPGLTDWATLAFIDEERLLAAHEDHERAYIEEIMPRKLALNLEYLRRQSVRTDLAILWETAARLVWRRDSIP
jgi:lipopolysaccharide/colanic/teichoic acid biosynthesis glycosyltransferase